MRLLELLRQDRLNLVWCVCSSSTCVALAQFLAKLDKLIDDGLRNRILNTSSATLIRELSGHTRLKRGEEALENLLLSLLCGTGLARLLSVIDGELAFIKQASDSPQTY
jgi:hypothetical protein